MAHLPRPENPSASPASESAAMSRLISDEAGQRSAGRQPKIGVGRKRKGLVFSNMPIRLKVGLVLGGVMGLLSLMVLLSR